MSISKMVVEGKCLKIHEGVSFIEAMTVYKHFTDNKLADAEWTGKYSSLDPLRVCIEDTGRELLVYDTHTMVVIKPGRDAVDVTLSIQLEEE